MLALFLSPRTVPNVSVYGSDHHFQDQWLNVKRCYLIFLHLVVGVSSSVWWFKNGNSCFVLVPMEVPRPHVTNEPTHTFDGEVLA